MLSEEKKQEVSEMVNYMEQLDNNGQALVFNLISCLLARQKMDEATSDTKKPA